MVETFYETNLGRLFSTLKSKMYTFNLYIYPKYIFMHNNSVTVLKCNIIYHNTLLAKISQIL